jgi:endonuclease/exonuclease/phosphatase family metal-dependent hydrolase
VPAALVVRAAAAGAIVARSPDGDRDEIVAAARRLGLALYYVPSMRNGPGGGAALAEDRGNAILSTLPLADFTAIELPFERQRRVAISATVGGAGLPVGRLRIGSVHLDATAGPGRLWIFASGLRSKQAASLVRATDPAESAVWGSDLNTWADGPGEPAFATLRATFPDSPPPGREPTFAHRLRLDYLLARLPDGWHTSAVRAPSRFGSDHYPLIGQVRAGAGR